MLLQIERTINSIYYCAPCSVAVKHCNREEHENTTQHINSVKHDVLLKQLSDMYIASDHNKIDPTETSAENNKHDRQHSNSKTDLNAIVTDISNLKTGTRDCPVLEIISCAKTNKLSSSQENNQNCDQQTDNGDNKNITDSLNNPGENQYQDMKKNENNDNDKVTESKDHMFKLVRINENVEGKGVERIKIKNSKGNTQMDLASKKLQNNDKALDESVNSNAVAKIHFCDICDEDIPYNSRKCIATHKSSDDHKKALDKHVEFLTTYQLVPVGSQKGQKFTSSTKRSKFWYCLVCCFEVKHPKPHVRESSHMMMYVKLLSVNLLIKLRYELFLCKYCDCFVKKGEELKHVSADAKHLVTKRFPVLTGFVTSSTAIGNNHELTQLDNLHDYSSSRTSVEALNSRQHSNNEVESKIDTKNTFSDLRPRLLSENDIEESEKPSHCFCTVCKAHIANNDFNIRQHMTGNTHMQKAKLLDIEVDSKEREYVSSVHNIPINLDNSSHEIGNKREVKCKDSEGWMEVKNQQHTRNITDVIGPHNNKPVKQNLDLHFCKICNVPVPNTPFNIDTHDNGNPHKRNLKQLTEEQK